MYELLVLGAEYKIPSVLMQTLAPYCRLNTATNEHQILRQYSENKPEMLISPLPENAEAILRLVIKLRSVGWFVPVCAVVSKQDSQISGALERLGVTVEASMTGEWLAQSVVRQLALPCFTTRTDGPAELRD